MKDKLTKEIAEKLDIIVKTALEKGNANYRNLPPLNIGQFSNTKDVKKVDYIRYFEILKNFNSYIEICNDIDKNVCYAKPIKNTQQFYNNGGFVNLYNMQEQKENRKLEIEELEYEKLMAEFKQFKWNKYVIWATLGVSIILLLIQIFKRT